jgi:Transposase DDE domain
MAGLPLEVWIVGAYALFLALSAWVLERLARHSHRRSEQYHLSGFRYRHELDLWECPAGRELHRHQTDHRRRIVRYRAAAETCNACRLKPYCTDSSEGREIEHRADSWISSELRRFHYGLSLGLLMLAALILVLEVIRYHQPLELLWLGSLLAIAVGPRSTESGRCTSPPVRVG